MEISISALPIFSRHSACACEQLFALLANDLVVIQQIGHGRCRRRLAAGKLFQLLLETLDLAILLRHDPVGDLDRALDRLPFRDSLVVVAIVLFQRGQHPLLLSFPVHASAADHGRHGAAAALELGLQLGIGPFQLAHVLDGHLEASLQLVLALLVGRVARLFALALRQLLLQGVALLAQLLQLLRVRFCRRLRQLSRPADGSPGGPRPAPRASGPVPRRRCSTRRRPWYAQRLLCRRRLAPQLVLPLVGQGQLCLRVLQLLERSRQLDATRLLPSLRFGQQRFAHAQFLLELAGLDRASEAAAWPAFAASSCDCNSSSRTCAAARSLRCCSPRATCSSNPSQRTRNCAASSAPADCVPDSFRSSSANRCFSACAAVSDSASRSRSVSNFASSL